jgi:WD40 repeat protein
MAVQWVDEKIVLELVSMKRKSEEEGDALEESTFVLWEADTGRILRKVPASRARAFEVSPDGFWIAEGGEDGRLRIRSVDTLEVHQDYKVHDAAVSQVAWHPTKPVVITGSRDGTLRAWSVRDGTMLQSLRNHRNGDTKFHFEVSTKGDLVGIGFAFGPSLILPLDFSQMRE